MNIMPVSFTGLWEKGPAKKIKETYDEPSVPILWQKIIYHPNSDESKKQAKAEIAKYRETVLTIVDNRTKYSCRGNVIIHFNPVLGKKLPFTKSESKETENMSFTPFGLFTKK